MDDTQELTSRSAPRPAERQETSDTTTETSGKSKRRKLAILILLLMLGAVFSDAGFFSGDNPETSADTPEMEEIDELLADFSDATRSASTPDEWDHDDRLFGSRDGSTAVTTTSLSTQQPQDAGFTLTIPTSASTPRPAPSSGYAPSAAASPGIRFTGSIQPVR
ncbi:MAG: hypothetical protein R3C19_21670 [Planctomycetaceae bacterium]